ncbi:hypothetical protein EL06_25855 [Salmonella enterica subsp. diarizonae]|uniref:Uncharacterized protein n=1 Tax=Salmonella diarizonae TaxID=59204 RepID=A0A6C8Y4F1_SALDZ|nr:hypothetical protein [Salmonella enterica subsp. diarizonae]
MIREVYFPDQTACAISCGLNALIACHMGVMSGLNALPKPPKVKGGTPSALRATTPFKTAVFALFFSLFVPHKAN